MVDSNSRLHSAHWTGPDTGLVTLTRDWVGRKPPPLTWGRERQPLAELTALDTFAWATISGYFLEGAYLTFVFDTERFPQVETTSGIYVGGDFNGWGDAIGKRAWRLEPLTDAEGRTRHELTVLRRETLRGSSVRFKFVTGDGCWVEVPAEAPNAVTTDGFRNWEVRPTWSGRHRYVFQAPCTAIEAGDNAWLNWKDPHHEETLRVAPGPYLTSLSTSLPLGAHVEQNETIWRVFAPRASSVTICLREHAQAPERKISMRRVESTTWEVRVPGSRHGWQYDLLVDGDPSEPNAHFRGTQRILDPYALATVSPLGPALVWDRARLPKAGPFTVPAAADLVIVEGHVRDLVAQAPLDLPAEERAGLVGLRRWIESEGCHLRALGVNALELQPVHENDAGSADEYHWGYMTNNFFAPASQYARAPAQGSQIEELHALVEACHQAGLAVLLDVVYNHVGEPAHLLFLDRQYYFELDTQGELMNWSGCGNTFRANTPMGRHLIIESLKHYVTVFGIDGFRFDLAELIGLEVLQEIERELKAIKPGIILVAEPWSFRGNIVEGLRATGFASWNDGFREFAADYVGERGTTDGLRYFLGGSIGHHARVPVQSINYVESHDDWAWIDRITENVDRNGYWPTAHDRRRTHLMAAMLFGSLGVPMISAGQDFLRSKQGHRNTYQRGDLNALDYTRAAQYAGTFEYFRRWIALRRGPLGQVWRLTDAPRAGYLRFLPSLDRSAGAMLYNADKQLKGTRLLLAFNPHFEPARIPVPDLDLAAWKLVADTERVDAEGLVDARPPVVNGQLIVPPLSCALLAEK